MDQELLKDFLKNLEQNALEKALKIVDEKPKQIQKPQNDLEDQNVVMDFSKLFKKNHSKKPELGKNRQKKVNEQKSSNENKENIDQNAKNVQVIQPEVKLKNEIPKNLTITQEEMKQRKYLDQRRWFCLSRPQYQRSCGISSLMSNWNYLFSWLGVGTLPPISVEEALQILGVEKEGKLFQDTDFGTFTGNGTLIKWFKLLCKYFKVDGTAYIFWKMCGDNRTPGIDEKEALERLEEGLRNENMTFIYHAHDHYFCPVGYEIVPRRPPDAYKKLEDIDPNEVDHWIFIGEPSKRYPAFHIRQWSEIAKDISLGNPQYYDIRHPEKGIMERKGEYFKTTKAGTSIHCIMAFQKIIKKKKQAISIPKQIGQAGQLSEQTTIPQVQEDDNQEPVQSNEVNEVLEEPDNLNSDSREDLD
ncbi:hypothetical protein ABPG74_004268 [Tetrahymena malaccensis]